jgi:hypothetical protein
MPIRLLNARRLAEELGRGDVSSRTKGYYLFAGFVLWLVINATGFTTASPLWSWMSVIETAALLLITVLGFSYAYDAAGGDENPDFVAQFTCLYVPVSITTVLAVWAAYWAVRFGFRESIVAISESRMAFAISLGRIGSSLFGALVMLAVLLVQAITLYRITKLLRIMRSQRSAVNSLQQATPASGRA